VFEGESGVNTAGTTERGWDFPFQGNFSLSDLSTRGFSRVTCEFDGRGFR
jgi:hypothetical protein